MRPLSPALLPLVLGVHDGAGVPRQLPAHQLASDTGKSFRTTWLAGQSVVVFELLLWFLCFLGIIFLAKGEHFSRGTFHFHSFQGSESFQETIQNPRENSRLLKRTMVEKRMGNQGLELLLGLVETIKSEKPKGI